jgi:hypothetical protein
MDGAVAVAGNGRVDDELDRINGKVVGKVVGKVDGKVDVRVHGRVGAKGDAPALERAARLARPVSLAGHQLLPTLDALHPLLPDSGLRRGTVVAVEGAAATSLALALAAGASAAGSWVGVVGVPSLGLAAAAELGVALERLVLVAPPAPGEWATVAATMVDAFDVVLAAPPRRGGLAMGRRLQARVRERGAVLCTVRASGGTEPDLTLATTAVTWEGLEPGAGCLQARQVTVQATGRRAAARPRQATLWLPDASGQVRLEEPAIDLGQVVPLHQGRLVARSVDAVG